MALKKATKAAPTLFNNSATPAQRNGITHPALVYFGGKWRVAPKIIAHFPPHRKYIEPFGGAASVLLSKTPAANEIYNDLNDDLVNLFSVLRCPDQARQLIKRLRNTPYSEAEHRLAFERSIDPVEEARRVLVRSHMSFHPRGIFREKVIFRISRSKDAAAYVTTRNALRSLPAIVARLRHVTITSRPAIQLLDQDAPDALFYLDPPYVPSTRLSDAKYKFEMTLAEHEALLAHCRSLKGYCVISGYDSELYNDLLSDWHREEFFSQAFCLGQRKQTAKEVIWVSPQTRAALKKSAKKVQKGLGFSSKQRECVVIKTT